MEKRTTKGRSTKGKRSRNNTTYDSSIILRKIYRSMIDDLKPFRTDWFDKPRNCTAPVYLYWKPYDFKVMCQLELFHKRIILPSDESYDKIADRSKKAFCESQAGFGIRRETMRSRLVVEHARKMLAGMLGKFDYSSFFQKCSFGKKAAVGLPFRESYLDNRIARLNGSKEQLEWFKAALCEDIHLHRACRLGLKQFTDATVIAIKAVPKAFDKARLVAPDTVLGGFLSRGLGLYLREKLEESTHISLEVQQDYHKDLARKASLDGYNATLDMKQASDSFTWEHIVRLFPEDWWPVLDVVRTRNAEVTYSTGERQCLELKSCALMGSGHTFPLQTLLFYVLVKSTLELLGSKSEVNCYGDDIIMPSRLASYVIDIFNDLGFTINEGKSFVEGPFRESCGGDYHTGVDVRPFMPEHFCDKLRKHPYTEFLHKLYNGLLRRWEYEELPQTFDTILNEVLSVQGNLCPIPQELPETMGLYLIPAKYEQLVKRPVHKDGRCYYLVLSRKSKWRKPNTERIYYWYWLRRKTVGEPFDPFDVEMVAGSLSSQGEEPVKGDFRYCWVTR